MINAGGTAQDDKSQLGPQRFLALGTSFMEGGFSMDGGQGMRSTQPRPFACSVHGRVCAPVRICF